MRALVLVCSLLTTTAAIGETPIAWSASRPLLWDDFVGAVPVHAEPERVAATTASLTWSYEYALEMAGSTCVFRIVRIDSAAEFHPESSWVRPGHRTAAVLQHEQVHFDIAQRYKMIFDREAQALVGEDRPCRAGSERRATRYAQRTTEQLVGAVYDDVWRRYRAEQDAYDAETYHGIDSDAQAEWTEKLKPLLQAATGQ